MELTTRHAYNVANMDERLTLNMTENNASIDNYTDYFYMDSEYMSYAEYKAAAFINKYYLYVICGLGFPGNIACMVTLTLMRPFRSSDVYMMTLAFADFIALVIKLLFLKLTENNVQLGDLGCQLMYLFGSSIQTYANWVLVLLTFERFIAVWFPLRVKKACRRRNSVCGLFCMFVFIVCAHLQFLFTFKEDGHELQTWTCTPRDRYARFIQFVWYWIDGAMYALVPIVCLFIFNSLIIIAVRRSRQMQRRLSSREQRRPEEESISQQRQITVMLLAASIMFVILVLPNCVFFIVKEHLDWTGSGRKTAQYYLLQQLVFVLSDLSHALNFYLYCVSGRKFRNKFAYLLCYFKTGRLTRSNRATLSRDVTRERENVLSTGSTSMSIFTLSPRPSPVHICKPSQ